MWLLKTGDEAEAPFVFRILPGSIKTMGRSRGAEFFVDAALVSRLHCRLTAGATELVVDDLESTNGTFVNGHRVAHAVLKEGDRLGVGRVEFVVSKGSDRGQAGVKPRSDQGQTGVRPRSDRGRAGV
jgi:ABC transport system ATP-binding/permease protein